MVIQEEHFPSAHFIRYSGYPFPHTVISSAARNLPCTLLFLASFAKGFPFSAVSHTALYRCARKIPRLRSGWRCGSGVFPTYPLYGTWVIHPPYRHFERSREIFLALCSFLLLSQKFSPFPLSHLRRYTGVQERSLAFARDDDTGIALSQHILYTMRRISPYDAKEKRGCEIIAPWTQKRTFDFCESKVLFCVRI